MDTKKNFNIRLDEEVIDDLDKIASAHGMDKNSYARVVLSKFSQLKQDHALDAITSIPHAYYRQRGGRPGKPEETATAA